MISVALLVRFSNIKNKLEPDDDKEFIKNAFFHQHLIRLLATLSEGENRICESICRNILSIDDIIEVLQEPKIHKDLKRPYLRFFLWSYMHVAGVRHFDQKQKQTNKKQQKTTNKQTNNKQQQNKKKKKKGLIEPATAQIVHQDKFWKILREITEKMEEVAINIEAPNIKANTLSEDIVYAFEAGIPFFSTFYERYYIPNERLKEKIPYFQELTDRIFQSIFFFSFFLPF